MVFVKVRETYDLCTNVDKMGLIGIHTPDCKLLKSLWAGLGMNHKFFRFAECDVSMACASTLPADPLQIGVEAGDIAPQDMFNPILFKAVSSDGMSKLERRIWGDTLAQTGALNKNSAMVDDAPTFLNAENAEIDQFELYYSLLANPDGWRMSMPQEGMSMKALKPLVYEVLSSNPGNYASGDQYGSGSFDGVVGTTEGFNDLTPQNLTYKNVFRGAPKPMPRIPTQDALSTYMQLGSVPDPLGNNVYVPDNMVMVPPVYVAAIVMPPARLHKLYYRMSVVWTIEFSELCPLTDNAVFQSQAGMGAQSYATDYTLASEKMSSKTSSVDTINADVTKIMESGR